MWNIAWGKVNRSENFTGFSKKVFLGGAFNKTLYVSIATPAIGVEFVSKCLP